MSHNKRSSHNWGIVTDFFRLIFLFPQGRRIFLLKEYQKFAGLMRWTARIYRRTFIRNTHLAVVVGSLGKTTTRRVLHSALDCPERGFSHMNYGVSLAENLLRIKPGDKHAAIEAGIGGSGWMAVYSWFIQPDLVVVTSIKSDHYRSFPTLEDTREEKVQIVRALSKDKVVFLNGDDPHVRWMATQTRATVVTFGLRKDNDIRAINVKQEGASLSFDVQLRDHHLSVRMKFVGKHMIYSFLAALAVTESEGGNLEAALSRIEQLEPEDSRLELLRAQSGATIIDDSFKGGMETVYAGLDALASMPAKRRFFLFGGVEDPPGKERAINRELGRYAADKVDRVVCMRNKTNMVSFRSGAVKSGLSFDAVLIVGTDTDAAMKVLSRELSPGDVLLVKGRSRMRMRRIVLYMTGKKVSCPVVYCGVKVPSCDVCPLLNASAEWFGNHFVSRYVRQ